MEQVREIIEKADEMLSEDVSVEPEGDQGLESMRTKDDGFFPGSQVCEGQIFLATHVGGFGLMVLAAELARNRNCLP